jgi:hypothetical protein
MACEIEMENRTETWVQMQQCVAQGNCSVHFVAQSRPGRWRRYKQNIVGCDCNLLCGLYLWVNADPRAWDFHYNVIGMYPESHFLVVTKLRRNVLYDRSLQRHL